MVCNSILKNAAFDSVIVRNRGYKISIRNGCIFANYQVTVGCDGVPCVYGKKIIVCWRTGAQGQNFTIFIGIVSPAITSVDIMLVDCLVRDVVQNGIAALPDFEFGTAAAPTTPPSIRHWRRSSSLLPKGEPRAIPDLAASTLCDALPLPSGEVAVRKH